MNILCVGLSHHRAPINIREQFSFSQSEQEEFYQQLRSCPSVKEGFLLSTCNRTEIYVNASDEESAREDLLAIVFSLKRMARQKSMEQYFYSLTGEDAVYHLFRVSCGLDSLVMGEKQILGQVKKAFALARKHHCLKKSFNLLTHVITRCGKKAQHETNISYGGSSVSWAAVVLAEKYLKTLKNKSVLVIGAGKMGKLSINQLKNKGLEKVYLMNRTFENAEALAEEIDGIAEPFSNMEEVLLKTDLCVCSSGAPHYVIEEGMLRRIMEQRQSRPMVLVDIAVPRNIDPKIAALNNVSLYSIDDLEEVTQSILAKRHKAVPLVEAIIAEKFEEFYRKLDKAGKWDPQALPLSLASHLHYHI